MLVRARDVYAVVIHMHNIFIAFSRVVVQGEAQHRDGQSSKTQGDAEQREKQSRRTRKSEEKQGEARRINEMQRCGAEERG